MSNAMTGGELILGLCVIAILVGLGAMVYRTRALSRTGNLAVLATRHPGGSWRTGMVRYRPDKLEWFSFRSLRFTPERVWDRGEFILGSRNTLSSDQLPRAMTGDAVSVDVEYGPQRFSIAMAPVDYTALRSWSESAPPGLHADRF